MIFFSYFYSSFFLRNKKNFYYKNGIEDYFKLQYSNKDKLFEKDFSLNNKLNQNENYEVYISFNNIDEIVIMLYLKICVKKN